MSTPSSSEYSSRSHRSPSWWHRFLSPGWIITTILAVAFSYFAITVLSPWQLNKDDAIVARNEQIEAAYKAEPVPAKDVLGPEGKLDPADEWTRVTLHGRYLSDAEVLLRMRPVDQTPAFQSLVPFELADGGVVLVHRGWLPSGGGGTEIPNIPAAPTGTVTLVGMARLGEPVSDRPPLEGQGYQQVYSINPAQIGELTSTDLGADYVMLIDEQPGALNPMPVPKLDRGSHLSYGFQWLFFGIAAPVGVIYLGYAQVKERRRAEAEDAEMAELEGADSAADSVELDEDAWLETAPNTYTVVRSRNVRDRYGDSKPDYFGRLRKKQRERF